MSPIAQLRHHGLNIVVLSLLFVASIALRLPYMDRPLSHNFEWSTAHTLIVQQIWYEEGALKNKFAQKMNFNRDADKFINNASMSNHYEDYPIGFDGSYFYLSNPTFGIIPPYLLFKALNIYPTPKAIQYFNLALQFLCTLLLYLTVERKTRPASGLVNFPAIVAGAVYLLLPTTLWFHSNVYYIEMFVQLPFILTVFFLTLYLDAPGGRTKRRYLYLTTLALFFTATTEWTGVFLGATICLYVMVNWKKGLDLKLFAFTCLATGLGLGIFVFHNSLVVGFSEFINHEIRQFFYQSNNVENLAADKSAKLATILRHYHIGAYPALFLVLATFIGAFAKITWQDFRARFGPLFFFLLLPCLMHHILLSRFTTEHWFSILKTTFFLAALLACLVYYSQFLFRNRLTFYALFTLAALSLTPNAHHNYLYHSITGGDPNHYKNLGLYIKEHAEDDEVVFLVHSDARPQIVYYARRNIQPVPSVAAAEEWLKEGKNSVKKGIVFIPKEATFERIAVE